jgi:hypothetical protein
VRGGRGGAECRRLDPIRLNSAVIGSNLFNRSSLRGFGDTSLRIRHSCATPLRQDDAVTEIQNAYRLAHPIYLDVAMMTSFLAYLDGGVVTEEEATQKETGARERVFKGHGGLSVKLPWALNVDAGTEGSGQRRDEVSVESKFARQHTNASLFNLLYQYLSSDEKLTMLNDASQLESLQTSQLVELSGEYLGNPLEDILGFVGAVFPYVLDQQRATADAAADAADKAKRTQRSGNPAKRAQAPTTPDNPGIALAELARQTQDFGVQVMLRMADDITQVPVHDILFRTTSGLEAVVTASSEYYSKETSEYLRAGEFRVVGKVTRVITKDDSINLTRRTVLGAANSKVAEDIVSNARSAEFQLDVADPIVKGPAVQILPMAIFI